MPELSRKGERVYRGIPVSGGVCHGPVFILRKPTECIPAHSITEAEIPQELSRLENAIIQTRQQLLAVQKQVSEAMGADDASIFDAHLLVLEDQTLLDEVTRVINEEKVNVEQAFGRVAEKYAATLGSINDDYLRERASDMRDVTSRILNNLLGRQDSPMKGVQSRCILASYDLSPSTTAQLDKKLVLGFVTDIGGQTSHTAIMARSLQIPAAVGVHNISNLVENGEDALLDGYNGLLIINPTDQTLFEYGKLVSQKISIQEKLREIIDQPAVTLDGRRITLSANIGQISDTEAVQNSGAEGVGLFRTEFLFINKEELPSEEEQYEAYRKVAATLKPNPVVIRTLDLGGDKFLTNLQVPMEMNPFLGWRAIRYCLQEKEVFRTQLRAILRASVEGNIKMMYPMISCLEELKQANALVAEYKLELTREGLPFDPNLEIGIMIEIPSAALIASTLARHSRFFSIGSNDLIQYSMAVDRLNEKIAHLYEPTHPAIIKLIRMSVEAAHTRGIWTGVCGEIASDLIMVPLLLGLGVDELSVAPGYVPQVKFLIRRLKLSEAKLLADFALECESGAEIKARAQAFAQQIAPSLFEHHRSPES
ncbi:MAG: phosphoenolpyruvate--protein phosphotransferase [Verrucomicrobiota bacterium]|nr:phosphoenolpyruvate--protein phosphotransferase [Verrucomicrobiota bacterium]